MKTKLILIAALMLLAFTASAFAQATFTVSSVPQTTVANSGYTEKTGDISFTTIANSGAAVTGTITITYGVPITNSAITLANNVVVTGAGAPVVSVLSVPPYGTQLVLGLGAQASATPFSIRVTGIRVAVADTLLTTLDATLSSTGNGYTAGQTSVRVINSIAAGIASFTSSAPVSISALTGGSGTATLSLTEGFLDAFGVTQATDTTQTVSHMVKINVSAAPPAGITFTFPINGFSGATSIFTICDATGTIAATPATLVITSATPTPIAVYYRVTTDTNLLAADTFTFAVTVAAAAPATAYSDLTITTNASMAPIATVNPTAIPRFKEVPVGAASLIVITRATTTMLIPYAVSQSVVNGYDTGIAIANTTKDPGAAALALASGAVPQFGKITFYFYPLGGGTPFTYATVAGSPGSGLSADGTVAAGSSYVVLLSQLLNAAGKSLDYSGYIIAVTSFTNAHGQYFISNFEAFTNGALMEVLTAGRAAGGEALDH